MAARTDLDTEPRGAGCASIAEQTFGAVDEEVATHMYKSPELKKLGTFREITQAGVHGPSDRVGMLNDGCGWATSGRCS